MVLEPKDIEQGEEEGRKMKDEEDKGTREYIDAWDWESVYQPRFLETRITEEKVRIAHLSRS